MNLRDAKSVLLRTHTSALALGERAPGVVLVSGPGVGKSDVVGHDYPLDLCLILDKPVGVVVEMLATITSADVRGFMIPMKAANPGELPRTVFSLPPWYPVHQNIFVFEPVGKNRVRVWSPGSWEGELPEHGVLFLDEFGQADEEIKKPAAELIYRGTVGTTSLPLGWRVVAASNRVSDRSGVMRELMFVVNRRLLINVTAEVKPWVEWAEGLPEKKKLHEMTITFAEKHPGVVFKDSIPEGDQPFCTPRSLVMMDRTLKSLRSPEDITRNILPLDDVAREAAAGLIGEGSAGQFYTHMRFFDEIPDLEDVEDNPDEAKMPPGRDGQMVVVYMLARRVTEDNATALVKYVSRMTAEMQILALGVFNGNASAQKVFMTSTAYQTMLRRHGDRLRAAEA